MKLDKDVPKPWLDSASGIYYTNFRIPADLVPHYNKTHIQKSLRTKDTKKAKDLNDKKWALLLNEFDRIRRERTVGVSLTEEFIPHLLDEWLHFSLREDEELRLRCSSARTNENNELVYYDMIDELREGARTGKHPDFLLRDAAWFFKQKGIEYDSRSIAFAKFIEELSPRYARYLNTLASRDRGEHEPTPPPPKQSLILLSEVTKEFLGSRSRGKATALKKDSACVAKLLEIVGDKPITALKQQDMRDFFDVVQRLPSQRGGPKKPNGVTLRAWAGDDVTMSPETFKNNYVAPIRHLLKWAKSTYHDQGFPVGLTVDAITYQGTRVKGEDKQRAFKRPELERMFLGEEMQAIASDPEKAGRYWLPLLGLFTGARINEVCQINPEVDWIEQEGIQCLSITTETEPGEDITKSIKTGTPRIVPIHPKLIELGFLAYLERVKTSGTGGLFPEFKPKGGKAGERAREWFSSFIADSGLRDDTPFAKITGFHAFRHTLITYAANHEDVSMESAIDQITGHVGQGSAVKRGYISIRAIKRAYETVCKVDFGLEFWSPKRSQRESL